MTQLSSRAAFRKELMDRGGRTMTKCYQCATCSSVCELSPANAPFPRSQMLSAQWGLEDRLIGDPAIWLCHQCNDCTTRCPRDAKPGEVMQALRSMTIEKLAIPGAFGKLVGKISLTWPVVLGLPLLFWAAFIYAFNGLPGLAVPENFHAFHQFVPHWMVYIVNIPAFGFAFLAIGISAAKAWKMWGTGAERKGSFVSELIGACIEIASHKRFNKCGTAKSRARGHFLFMWGFIGAFITTGLVVIWYYGFGTELPFALDHPWKILGNISAVLLVTGGAALLINRLKPDQSAGVSTAFDNFFLFLILSVAATGVLTEVSREFVKNAELACWSYLIHLGFVLCLFLTLPYCKFAHFVYRTLAMTHERMVART
jgi:quinone-modifying oxidoreductase, subunit QmoC